MYHSLIAYRDNVWSIIFGDYDKEVVMDEKHDMMDSEGIPAKHLKIMSTRADQASIFAKLDAINSNGA